MAVVLYPNSIVRDIRQKLGEIPSILDFAGRGNDSYDNVDAMEYAYDSIGSGSLFIPAGVYQTSSGLLLHRNLSLYGVPGKSTIKLVGSPAYPANDIVRFKSKTGWAGTASVTASSQAVTWLSGDTFDSSLAGKKILLSQEAFPYEIQYQVLTVNSPTSITLTATSVPLATETVRYTAGAKLFNGALTAGDYQFVLDSVNHLAVGDIVQLRLGSDPYDPTVHFSSIFVMITVINVGTLTISVHPSIPEDVAAATGTGRATTHEVVWFPEGVIESPRIDGVGFDYDTAGGGPDQSVIFDACRNAYWGNAFSPRVTIGCGDIQSENTTLENLYFDRTIMTVDGMGQPRTYQGRIFVGQQCRNARLSHIYCSNCEGSGIFFENQNRGVTITDLSLNYAQDVAAQAGVEVLGQSTGIVVDGYIFNADTASVPLRVLEGSIARARNVKLQNGIAVYPLDRHDSDTLLEFDGGAWSETRTFSMMLDIPVSGTLDVDLPSGMYKRIRAYVSDFTGLTGLFLLTGVQGYNFAGIQTVTMNAAGSGYSANDILNIVGGGGSGGKVKILTVDGSGIPQTYELNAAGKEYVGATGLATTYGGAGTGFTVNITVALIDGWTVDLSGSATIVGTQAVLNSAMSKHVALVGDATVNLGAYVVLEIERYVPNTGNDESNAAIQDMRQLQIAREIWLKEENGLGALKFTDSSGAPDCTVYRLGPGVIGTDDSTLLFDRASAASNEALKTRQTGDGNYRFILGISGAMLWGAGSGAGDVSLARTGVGQLQVTGALTVTGTLAASGGFSGTINVATTTSILVSGGIVTGVV